MSAPFSRIMRAKFIPGKNGKRDKVKYFHPTKGWRLRDATPEFMAMLRVST